MADTMNPELIRLVMKAAEKLVKEGKAEYTIKDGKPALKLIKPSTVKETR